MITFRITKFNLTYRDEKGVYQRNEWTSFNDIGNNLTLNEYIATENKYIKAVQLFMKCLGINKLTIKALEKRIELSKKAKKYSKLYPQKMNRLFASLKEDYILDKDAIEMVCRLALRENLWCKLNDPNNRMFVHFGYDYYMYIGVEKSCKNTVDEINKQGLFVEVFESPYL